MTRTKLVLNSGTGKMSSKFEESVGKEVHGVILELAIGLSTAMVWSTVSME